MWTVIFAACGVVGILVGVLIDTYFMPTPPKHKKPLPRRSDLPHHVSQSYVSKVYDWQTDEDFL